MEEKTSKKSTLNYLYSIAVITAVYAATALLGLYALAMPPGYATPIWIPSGFALGAIIIWGPRVALPGIFLGSFITNFYISLLNFSGQIYLMPVLIAYVIATGAVLQAGLGWLLIKKYVGLHNRLNSPIDILAFIFLSGPISCLVNTTWSNTILSLLQIVPFAEYFYNWSTWWIGDSIGVLIFTPIVLILFARPHSVWRRRIFPILIPLCVSFAGVVSLYLTVSKFVPMNEMWPVLITGLMFCVLISVILFIVHGQNNIAQLRMTAQKTAFRLAEEKNSQILRSAGEGIFGVDTEGIVTFINPAAVRMLGFRENEIIGQSVYDKVQHAHDSGRYAPKSKSNILETIRDNKIGYMRSEVFWRKNGEPFWVDYTCTPLIENGKTTGAVIVFNDMTQQRETEAQLEKMAHYDALTQLPNRYSFLVKLNAVLEEAKQNHQTFAVCFIDLDNFKQINDNLGHAVGDETLKRIPGLLHPELTSKDYLARL